MHDTQWCASRIYICRERRPSRLLPFPFALPHTHTVVSLAQRDRFTIANDNRIHSSESQLSRSRYRRFASESTFRIIWSINLRWMYILSSACSAVHILQSSTCRSGGMCECVTHECWFEWVHTALGNPASGCTHYTLCTHCRVYNFEMCFAPVLITWFICCCEVQMKI